MPRGVIMAKQAQFDLSKNPAFQEGSAKVSATRFSNLLSCEKRMTSRDLHHTGNIARSVIAQSREFGKQNGTEVTVSFKNGITRKQGLHEYPSLLLKRTMDVLLLATQANGGAGQISVDVAMKDGGLDISLSPGLGHVPDDIGKALSAAASRLNATVNFFDGKTELTLHFAK